jgi:hypothetical protein
MSLEAWFTLLMLAIEFTLGIGIACYFVGVYLRWRRHKRHRTELEQHPIVTYFEPPLTDAERREMERWED